MSERALLFDLYKAFRGPCDLTSPQRVLLAALVDYGCNTTGYHPSITALEVATAMQRRTVTRLLEELDLAGWITRIRKPPHATEYVLSVDRITTSASAYLEAPKRHNRKRSARDVGSLGTIGLGTEEPQARDVGSLAQGQRIPSARDVGSPERLSSPKKTKEGQSAREATAGPPSGVVRKETPSPTSPDAPDWLEHFGIPALDSEDGEQVERFLDFFGDKDLKKPGAAWKKWTTSEHFVQNSGPSTEYVEARERAERRERDAELGRKFAERQAAEREAESTPEKMRESTLAFYKNFGTIPAPLREYLPQEIQDEIAAKENGKQRVAAQRALERNPATVPEELVAFLSDEEKATYSAAWTAAWARSCRGPVVQPPVAPGLPTWRANELGDADETAREQREHPERWIAI